jgi:hypothetical protein
MLTLDPVDSLDVHVLVDNTTDNLSSVPALQPIEPVHHTGKPALLYATVEVRALPRPRTLLSGGLPPLLDLAS